MSEDQDITNTDEQAHFDNASRRFFASVNGKKSPADKSLAHPQDWPDFQFKPHPSMSGVLMIRAWQGGRPFQYHITERWLKLPSTEGPFFFHNMEFSYAMKAIIAMSQLEDMWVE